MSSTRTFRSAIRTALRAACVVIATVGSAAYAADPPAVRASAAAAKPKNIIFVLVDDLRYDAMGFLTPGLRTPNIDFLAKNGVYFPNAVVTTSLCSPSRATILTGLSTRNHGVVDNNNSSEAGLTFFPSYLQKAKYQTAFIGKWHMGYDDDRPRAGFDKWVSFKGQGNYFPADAVPGRAGVQRTMLNVDGKEVPQKGYITDELTDYAMNWLEHERDPARPFFLYLSHKAVHSAPLPPERYKNQYAKLDVKLPASVANTPENYAGKPRWVRDQRNSWHGVDFMYNSSVSLTDYIRTYYATLSPVDDSLGRILKYLRDNKLEQDTVIVFYSDNGFLFGDHGLIDKRNAYEPSVRVPLVMYSPGMLPRGAVNDALVRNLDLAPTFLDVANVKKPAQMEGSSFLSVARGDPGARWKPGDFVYEYYWEWSFPETPTTFAIERDRLKYIQYHGIWDLEELYDLSKDPDEMHNLIDESAYIEKKITLRKALFESLANRSHARVVPFTERFSEGQVRRNLQGAEAAPFPQQWLAEPDRPDRFNTMQPETPAVRAATDAHKVYVPADGSGAH